MIFRRAAPLKLYNHSNQERHWSVYNGHYTVRLRKRCKRMDIIETARDKILSRGLKKKLTEHLSVTHGHLPKCPLPQSSLLLLSAVMGTKSKAR